jgi:hypothetical protein
MYKIMGLRPSSVKLVYSLTTANSRLRQYFIDAWVTCGASNWAKDNIQFYLGSTCDDFLSEIIPRLMVKDFNGKDIFPNECPWVYPWERDQLTIILNRRRR